MSEYTGPLPVPTPETRPFWEATRRHELLLQRCRACGRHHFYPRGACPHCLSADLEWQRVSGRGSLHTFTVVHRGARNFPLPSPYVLAVVELEAGPRLMTNLIGKYIFADYSGAGGGINGPGGRLFYADLNTGQINEFTGGIKSLGGVFIKGMGEDSNGCGCVGKRSSRHPRCFEQRHERKEA